jgi:hypothetical protein
MSSENKAFEAAAAIIFTVAAILLIAYTVGY